MNESTSLGGTPHVTSTTPYGLTVNCSLNEIRYQKKIIRYVCPCCGKAVKITIEEEE